MSIKKQFLKSKPECKVTFKFVKTDGLEPESVKVIGDFNNWDTAVEPMKPLKSGEFTQTISLTSGNNVQFRYLINDEIWFNDDEADAYVENGLGGAETNCVIHL